MVWLQAHRHCSGQADCRAKAGYDIASAAPRESDPGCASASRRLQPSRGEAAADVGQRSCGLRLLEKPLAKFANGEMAISERMPAASCVSMMRRVTSSCFVRNDSFIKKVLQRNISQRKLRRGPFEFRLSRNPASASPERAGTAFASSIFRSSKRYVTAANRVRKRHIRSIRRSLADAATRFFKWRRR